MTKKVPLLLALACLASCRAPRPGLDPPAGPHFRSLSIKFRFQDGEARQNGRVVWRFDAERSKFLFFSPLNQVSLELDVDGEEAVLVNFARKAYWRGGFSQLLERMWGIGLTLAELKSLVTEGRVPQAALDARGIAVDLEPGAGGEAPRSVRLRRGAADVSLRLQKDARQPGRIVLIPFAGRYRECDLDGVLEE